MVRDNSLLIRLRLRYNGALESSLLTFVVDWMELEAKTWCAMQVLGQIYYARRGRAAEEGE
jgi:hypothetical protein